MVSVVHRSRVAGPLANQIHDQDILVALDPCLARGTDYSQPGEFTPDGFRHLHYTGGCSWPPLGYLMVGGF